MTRIKENLGLRYQGLMLLLFPRSTAQRMGVAIANKLKLTGAPYA